MFSSRIQACILPFNFEKLQKYRYRLWKQKNIPNVMAEIWIVDRFGSFSVQTEWNADEKKALRKSILGNKKRKQEKENEQNYRFDTKALKSQRSRSTIYKMNQWNGAKNVENNRRRKKVSGYHSVVLSSFIFEQFIKCFIRIQHTRYPASELHYRLFMVSVASNFIPSTEHHRILFSKTRSFLLYCNSI